MAVSRGVVTCFLILISASLLPQCGFDDVRNPIIDTWEPSNLGTMDRTLSDSPIRINELYDDEVGSDIGTFTELIGPPGASLADLRLVGINGRNGAVYAQISLTGYTIGQTGLFVIAQAPKPEADLIAKQVNWQNGPDRVELRNSNIVLDGLTYGDPNGTALPADGGHIVQAGPGFSLGSCLAGSASGSAFVEQTPTPGGVNACPMVVPGPGQQPGSGQQPDASPPSQGWNDVSSCAPLYAYSGSTLRNKLLAMVDNQKVLTYIDARTIMYTKLDLHNGDLECAYSGRTVHTNGRMPTPTEMNCEHTWPQSQGAVDDAKTDLHHLFPANPVVNSTRNNVSFGWAKQAEWEEGGSKLGKDEQGNRVFEVRMEQRGDSARAMLYFATRYSKPIANDIEMALKAWNRQDLPDVRERARNDAIDKVQNNRNPFVDCPSLVDRIDDF